MMFDKKEYREMFSQVTASPETYRRVMNMRKKETKRGNPLVRVALVAAILAMMVVTVSASETVQNWFLGFFSDRSEDALSQGQVEYIENNAQTIQDSQSIDGWTVELRSAITDGTKAYIIIGVSAPEEVNLTQRVVNDSIKDWFGPGNAIKDIDEVIIPSVPIASIEGNYYYQVGRSWQEDGDGLDNTKNMVFSLSFGTFFQAEPCAVTEPFGPEIDFEIVIEDIIREYEDEEYRKELMEGKYAGQTDVMFTHEETLRLNQVETLAEGTWKFKVNFAEHQAGVELLSQPIAVTMDIWRQFGDSIEDYDHFREAVTVTSVVVRPLSVTLSYEDCNGGPGFINFDAKPCVVMLDGSQIVLHNYGGGGTGSMTLEAETPIILEEADHILLPDGTIIPMPDITE